MGVTADFSRVISGRSVIGDTVTEIGEVDNRLWVVTPDIGGALSDFRTKCKDRFIDVGIAEQNCVTVAAGLALEGNIPVIMGMLPFMSMRACEQVRTDVCYQNLPVRIIGTGGGLTSGGGSTHNAMEDLAILRSFVNMTVFSLGDPLMIRDVLKLGMTHPGPMYIRLAQGKADAVIYEQGTVKVEIGGAVTAREGKDVAIFSHGELIRQALEAANDLAAQGINARVLDMYSIKPINKEVILAAAKETGGIVVVEDHLMEGGLASAISDVLVDNNVAPKAFKRLGIPQVYAGFGSGAEQRKKYGYDKDATIAAVKAILKK